MAKSVEILSSIENVDVETLNAFRCLAKKSNMSFPKFLESRMIDIAKAEGEIDGDYEMLGEPVVVTVTHLTRLES